MQRFCNDSWAMCKRQGSCLKVEHLWLLGCMLVYCCTLSAQDTTVQLFRQFNGPFDFICFGNTLNTGENNLQQASDVCTIQTQSSASYYLPPGQVLEKAYLYWAGSGTGDFEVKLNQVPIQKTRSFSLIQPSSGLPFFSAFADVTELLQAQGQGTYTLSDFDLTTVIPDYCLNATNFGGWAVVVIYRDNHLPINQINIYDGLQGVPPDVQIGLDHLNVIDAVGAKIGFVAWEGDASLAVAETLSINNQVLSDPPLNPANNAFNGTNGFTGANNLYNMDLDVYNIQNNIHPGDTTAQIALTSGQDFVMINVVLTKLNTLLSDLTVEQAHVQTLCGRTLQVQYTLKNTLGIAAVPAQTPVSFYVGNTLLATVSNNAIIAAGGSTIGTATLIIPEGIQVPFSLTISADDNGQGTGVVSESNENNNTLAVVIDQLWDNPQLSSFQPPASCMRSDGSAVFDLQAIGTALLQNPQNDLQWYSNLSQAQNQMSPLPTQTPTVMQSLPAVLYVRVNDTHGCYHIQPITLTGILCGASATWTQLENRCDSNELSLSVAIYNPNNTELPQGMPIRISANGVVLQVDHLSSSLAPSATIAMEWVVQLPPDSPNPSWIEVVVGADAQGPVSYLLPFTLSQWLNLRRSPLLKTAPSLTACNEGYGAAHFDLASALLQMQTSPTDQLQAYANIEQALAQQYPLSPTEAWPCGPCANEVIVRADNASGCPAWGTMPLRVRNCPPEVFNYVSANTDGANDRFYIKGLRHIFTQFELKIYNRWGTLVFETHEEGPDWTGEHPLGGVGKSTVPDGTYYYVLDLHDPDYPEPLTGYIYLNQGK